MHSDLVLDHFRSPRHVGELSVPAVTVEVMNPACGDVLRLSARFEGDRVVEARFKTMGCAASIAAGSALAEWLHGRSRRELAAFEARVVEEALGGLAPASQHAAELCADGVKALLK